MFYRHEAQSTVPPDWAVEHDDLGLGQEVRIEQALDGGVEGVDVTFRQVHGGAAEPDLAERLTIHLELPRG